ncbi:MAG TPA: carboxypeptidase regulatory-like domain-containing protein, partial [Candidatus Acidoferrum sp.]|nr:carboxypeptidase regulatory-like domain-containing protein [Candidatus Acidoferrum sp.]
MSFRKIVLSISVFLLCLAGVAQAQNLGSLTVQVTDPNKKAVVGATVHLVEVGTDTGRDGTTNDQGTFTFQQLKPAIYTVKIEAKNFKTAVQQRVQVLVATPTSLSVSLEIGAMAENVVVTAEAVPQLNTEDATIGDVMDESKIKSLPLYARNPVALLGFQPGVIVTGSVDLDEVSFGGRSNDMRNGTVNGVRSNQMNVTLDGGDNNDQQNHDAFASALPVTLDSLQEFRVTTGQANSDEGGASGAQVALVTKSGTNEFHGNLRWYYRTTGPTASSFFANFDGVPRAKLDRNIPGASLGGHIWKDRVFFFADFEDRQDASEALTGNQVPTAALADGALIYNCAVPASCPGGSVHGLTQSWPVPAGDFGLTPAQIKALDPYTYSGNATLMAAAGINPAMLTYMKLFPAGNSPELSNDGGLAFNFLAFNTPGNISENIYTARMDFNITKNGHHTAYVRGTLAGIAEDQGAEQFPGQPVSSVLLNNSRGIAAGYTGQFTPNLVDNFIYSYTRRGLDTSGAADSDAFSIRFFASNVAFTYGSGRIQPSHDFKDNVSWTHGKHTIEFGGDMDFIRNHRISDGPGFASFQANPGNCNDCGQLQAGGLETPGLAGLGLPVAEDTNNFNAAYLMLTGSINAAGATFLGDPATGAIQAHGTPEVRDFAEDNFGLYIKDSYKIKPNLTITAGVRWEYQTPVWEVNGFQVAPTVDVYQWFLTREQNAVNGVGNQASPLLSWAPAGKANNMPSWYHPNYKNFSPRVAIAWSPGYTEGILSKLFGGAGNSSVRAGFSIDYDQVGQTLATTADAEGSPGTATALANPTTQYGLISAPRFSGVCGSSGCTGLPPLTDYVTPPASATFPFTPDLSTGNQDFVVDPHLKTPYTMNMSLDFQRELPKGFVLDIAYVGTLGRRLLTKADFA